MRTKPSRAAPTAALLAIAALLATAGLASAAENVHDGLADPSTVQSGEAVQPHKFSYVVDNVSNDGSTDEIFVTFPDEVPKENLSSYSGDVTDVGTGKSVSISSSMSIVDGPDGDGVQESLKIGVQPEGERATIDLRVNFTGGKAEWPEVDSTTDFAMKASVTDSGGYNVNLVEFATVTVETSGSTSDGSTNDSTTDGSTDDSTSDSTSSSGDASVAVATDGVFLVSSSSAELAGEVTTTGGADTVDAQFTYWVEGSKSSTQTTTSVQQLSSAGEYSIQVDGLDPGTTYAFQADADASDGDTDTGDVQTFTTQEAQTTSGGSSSGGTSGGDTTDGSTSDGTSGGTSGGSSNDSGGNQAPLGAAPALAAGLAAAIAAARLRRG